MAKEKRLFGNLSHLCTHFAPFPEINAPVSNISKLAFLKCIILKTERFKTYCQRFGVCFTNYQERRSFSWPLVHYDVLVEVEELWKELTDNVLQPETKSVQACWDAPIYETQFKTLLKKQTVPSEQARLRAFASHQSSDWLNCLPIPAKWFKIR